MSFLKWVRVVGLAFLLFTPAWFLTVLALSGLLWTADQVSRVKFGLTKATPTMRLAAEWFADAVAVIGIAIVLPWPLRLFGLLAALVLGVMLVRQNMNNLSPVLDDMKKRKP